jgi:drug/metabolite transporter (DMT)-like permease
VPSVLRSQAVALLLLPLTCLAWAGNHVVARAVAGHVPPASLNAVRWLIVALAVLPFALPHLRADWPRIRRRPVVMAVAAMTGGALFGTLQYVALHFTTALNMGVVGSVAPAFIVAASWIVFRDRLSGSQLLGVLVSLSGVLAIVTRLDLGRLAGLSLNGGDLIIVVNMALFAAYSLSLRLRPSIHPATFMLAMAVVSVLANLPFALGEHAFGYTLRPTWLTAMAALYTAFVTTIVAYVAWNRAVDIVGAPRASAFLNTIPIFSALLATTLLGERIETYHVLGFALILGGVTLAARPAQASGAGDGLGGRQPGVGLRRSPEKSR